MTGRLPRFLGIGAQKAGTTTLHTLLAAHPQVYLPPVKEVHFFSLHYAQGAAWYTQQFAAAVPDQSCGEITPYYLFHPQAPRRIRALLPSVRLIALLRDPVERCLSQYFHARRLGLESLDLEAALRAEPQRLAGADLCLQPAAGRHLSHQEHSYVARSRYEEQLERYETHFPAAQLLVLRSEDLFEQPQYTWQRVLAFLQLDAYALPSGNLAPRVNAGAGETAAVPQALRAELRQQLNSTYGELERRYGLCW
jgi:hypothetical protein